MQIHRSFGLAVSLASLLGTTASASVLVHYDFENAIATGSAPERQWQVADLAGPDHTNLTLQETSKHTLDSFNGGQALYLDKTPISLGTGANGELATDFAGGLILETVFQLDEGSNITTTHQGIAYRENGFDLHIRGSETSSTYMKVRAIVNDGNANTFVDSSVAIEIGKTYRVRLEFDTALGVVALELENLTDGTPTAATTVATTFTSLGGADKDVFIGRAGLTSQTFKGHIDDFTITAVPEPGALALVSMAGVLMLARRRS